MTRRYSLVLERQRHLKWRLLDPVEQVLMVMCGLALAGFSCTVFFDVVTRSLGHPVLWVQEVTTTFFVYGIFIGAAAATRRSAGNAATTTPGDWSRVSAPSSRRAAVSQSA